MSARVKMLIAADRYIQAAEKFTSDPATYDEMLREKNGVDAATLEFNKACEAHWRAATQR